MYKLNQTRKLENNSIVEMATGNRPAINIVSVINAEHHTTKPTSFVQSALSTSFRRFILWLHNLRI